MSEKEKELSDCEGSGEECSQCRSEGCDSRKAAPNNPQDEQKEAERRLKTRMARVKHKIIVLSGKGGVGKSTVAVNLAVSLARQGKSVGLMDIDIHGPSIPTMLGLVGQYSDADLDGIRPLVSNGVKVMSVQFFMPDPDAAVIWRGPMKMKVISQFLSDVNWGELDYLVVDSPPGTGDEPLSIVQLLGNPDGAVIVTTPQKVAEADVRKSINFCDQLNLPVLGILENMNGFTCPHCRQTTPLFQSGAGKRLAGDYTIPFLGSIPFDLALGTSGEEGIPYVERFADSEIGKMYLNMAGKIADRIEGGKSTTEEDMDSSEKVKNTVKIAIPIGDGRLSMHFGHCESFALIEADPEGKTIVNRTDLSAPPHEPGLLPRWLSDKGAQLIIAGGMGQRAKGLFEDNGIKVIVGAPSETPEVLVARFLEGTLETGTNTCDH